jgi:hypothetical protein
VPHDTIPHVTAPVKSLSALPAKTFTLVIAAIAEVAQAASLAVAGHCEGSGPIPTLGAPAG